MKQSNAQKRAIKRANRKILQLTPGNEMLSHPPQLNGYEVRHSVRVRYITNSAIVQSVTFQNLLDTLLVAATATTAFDVFYAVKVRRVQLWATPLLGTSTSVGVTFGGAAAGQIGDQKIHTDTSMGIQPAHVAARPASKSLASDYQLSTAGQAMLLTGPLGTVVDVELSFVGAFANPIAAQNAIVGGSAGAFYTRGLDGLAIATTKFVPVLTVTQTI